MKHSTWNMEHEEENISSKTKRKVCSMIKVLVGGCFDVLHYGHIKFLKAAKRAGDYLLVALESDEKVRELKGKNRPIHKQSQRAEILESLSLVDEVIKLPYLRGDEDYFNLVKKVKPDIIAVTEGDPKIAQKKKQTKMVGAKLLVVTPLLKGYSTSKIAKKLILRNVLIFSSPSHKT